MTDTTFSFHKTRLALKSNFVAFYFKDFFMIPFIYHFVKSPKIYSVSKKRSLGRAGKIFNKTITNFNTLLLRPFESN